MNNRQSGRRRGRSSNSNNRPQSSSRIGYDSANRIDSRARGNAVQMIEKYKNMARDVQLSGDRVQAEYYLQFADHYFRVLRDFRARQEARLEEGRAQIQDRGQERGQNRGGNEAATRYAEENNENNDSDISENRQDQRSDSGSARNNGLVRGGDENTENSNGSDDRSSKPNDDRSSQSSDDRSSQSSDDRSSQTQR